MRLDTISLLAVVGVAATAILIGMEAPYVGILFVLAGVSVWQADMSGMYSVVPSRQWKRCGRVAVVWSVCMLPAYAVFLYWWNAPGDLLMTAAVLCCFVRTAPSVVPSGVACLKHMRASTA